VTEDVSPFSAQATNTAFNLGAVIDFTGHQHLLFSAGRCLDDPTDFQVYVAWQFTFGPEFFHSFARLFRK
jgi:hypothetical protein